jgi:hypothetical protein
MRVADMADADEAIAFAAFYEMVAPAMGAAMRGPSASVFHGGRRCPGPAVSSARARWCADCQEVLDDLLLASFARLRAAIAGVVCRTSAGEPVRELAAVAQQVLAAGAGALDAAETGAALRRQRLSAGGGGGWLRAAMAQLVVYPTRHLTSELRRQAAVRRGASARPDRDLRTAGWAAALREDAAALELLIWYVELVRQATAVDRAMMPGPLLRRFDLDQERAEARLAAALGQLRVVNPDFYAANMEPTEPLLVGSAVELSMMVDPAVVGPAASGPTRALSGSAARAALARLVRTRIVESTVVTARRRGYRAVLRAVCLAGDGDRRQGARVWRVCQDRLVLRSVAARRLVRRLVALVGVAGLDWVWWPVGDQPAMSRTGALTVRSPRR